MNSKEVKGPQGPMTVTSAAEGHSRDDPRITRALEEYMAALERGEQLSRSELLARYPGVADQLAERLDGLEFIHRVAPQLSDGGGDQSNRPTTEIRPEAALGDYRIVRQVGRGGMGVVYESVQISLGRTVALKVLPFATMLDERQLKRFKNEARGRDAGPPQHRLRPRRRQRARRALLRHAIHRRPKPCGGDRGSKGAESRVQSGGASRVQRRESRAGAERGHR